MSDRIELAVDECTGAMWGLFNLACDLLRLKDQWATTGVTPPDVHAEASAACATPEQVETIARLLGVDTDETLFGTVRAVKHYGPMTLEVYALTRTEAVA